VKIFNDSELLDFVIKKYNLTKDEIQSENQVPSEIMKHACDILNRGENEKISLIDQFETTQEGYEFLKQNFFNNPMLSKPKSAKDKKFVRVVFEDVEIEEYIKRRTSC